MQSDFSEIHNRGGYTLRLNSLSLRSAGAFMNFDFKNLELYHYLIMGGGALVVVSVLFYFLKGKKGKLSPFAATIMACLVVGFGAGVVTFASVGYDWNAKANQGPELPEPSTPDPNAPPKGKGKKNDMEKVQGLEGLCNAIVRRAFQPDVLSAG